MARRFILFILLIGVIALAAAGCAPQPDFAPTPTKTPSALPTPTVEALDAATAIPPAAAPETQTLEATSAEITEAVPGAEERTAPAVGTIAQATDTLLADHYWLVRPLGPDAQDYLDRTYPYGGTSGGRLRPHAGIDFPNTVGTLELAAADATVFYAGTDEETLFGPLPNFYGNVVVLQLDGLTYEGQQLYALYGHLSSMGVETGDTVRAGDPIGTVGGTGIANGGPHLHFEVRAGDPMSYEESTRNPDLWIAPYEGFGTLAGLITGPDGEPLQEVSLNIAGEDFTRYTWTYAGDENHGDDVFGENFTYGDLPQGWYDVSTSSGVKIYRQRVYVQAGRTAWVAFQFEE